MSDPSGRERVSTETLRFGNCDLDVAGYELRRNGRAVKLERLPMELLLFLVERRGQLVGRQEIVQKLWGDDVFFDVDTGLNTVILKIRQALRDSADHPTYIQTVTGKGYRFIAPIVVVAPAAVMAEDSGPTVRPTLLEPPASPVPHGTRRRLWHLLSPAAVLAILGLGLVRWHGSSNPVDSERLTSLAVLPFENLSGDPEQEYFADGMTDELITSLGRISDLRVISRTSVMQYKGARKPLPEIARELGVDSVVEGSVLLSGGTVRTTVRLVRANDDRQLWSDRYDREVVEIIALQSQMAQVITHQVHARLSRNGAAIAPSRPVNLEAYEQYLKGRYVWNRRTEADLHASVTYFERAIQLDPQYALAYAGLADSYILMGIWGLQPSDQTFPKARGAAEKALALDDTLAEAHTAVAEVRKDYDWDWKGAEREYRRAIELNGNYSTAHHWYAQLLSMLGRHQEAVAEIEQARHVDPVSPPINAYVAYIYFLAGQDDRAVSEGRQAVALEPQLAMAHFFLGRAYQQQRRMPEATAELETASRLSGGTAEFDAELAFAYARSGNRAGALAILQDLRHRGPTRYVSPLELAVVHAGLGDKLSALDALERAYQERIMRMTALSDPEFAELHDEPRFRLLLERLALAVAHH